MSGEINENTKLPLSFIAVAIPVLGACILYFAAIAYTALNAEKVNEEQAIQIKENRARIDSNERESTKVLFEINGRTIRIEEYLKHKGSK